MKIVDYIVVRGGVSTSLFGPVGTLVEKVKACMDCGWQPLGSPYVYAGEREQAMVKYEEPFKVSMELDDQAMQSVRWYWPDGSLRNERPPTDPDAQHGRDSFGNPYRRIQNSDGSYMLTSDPTIK